MFRITDLLARAARTWPDAPAISCAAGTQSWSALDARARRLAAALLARGAKRGDRIAWLGFNGRMGMETLFAAPLLGAAAAPLNFRLSAAEMIETLNDHRPCAIVVDAAHADTLAAVLPHCPSIHAVLVEGPAREGMEAYEDALTAADPGTLTGDMAGGGEDMLVMFYTGGTTGAPKGVMLSHTNIFANQMGILANWDMRPNEAYSITGPMFHSAAGARVYGAAMMGTHLALAPRFDIGDLLGRIETHRVAIAQFVPTMLAMMLDHPEFDRHDLSSLRLITYGAAPMPPDLLSRAMEAFPGVRFAQAFGMTEASPIVTFLNPEDHEDPDSPLLRSIGRTAPFVDLKIVDEDRRDLPVGEVGELAVRGANIMLGYWERPEATAAALVDGWYYTGDAGYVDADGYVFLSGRIKDMIITGGENVYPIEVETVLAHHPDVRAAAVIGSPDPKWGERVHAVVQLVEGAEEDPAALIAFCRERLAHYKAPSLVSFTAEPLPLTKVNKVDKQALRARYGGGA
ncbi:long-chain-fatty-acid--CoA ligase [Rhodovulum sp. DZ06]|uniref:long-chain-fatty-acid--CoA ligase n=1 Tax=Rhodovulum sp. DZ06 TaxID=3425126 RepID=UPI003D3477BA